MSKSLLKASNVEILRMTRSSSTKTKAPVEVTCKLRRSQSSLSCHSRARGILLGPSSRALVLYVGESTKGRQIHLGLDYANQQGSS
jgi:hypothetical protein